MPILAAEIVRTLADMIPDAAVSEGFSDEGISVGMQKSGEAKLFIDLPCLMAGKIFRGGVRPIVELGTCDVNVARGDGGEKEVLIIRHLFLAIGIFLVIWAKPLSVMIKTILDRATDLSAFAILAVS